MSKPQNSHMQRLVDALMFAFKIDTNDSLVEALGTGFEASNQEALATWIQQVLMNPDLQIAESVLPRLIDRLEQSLRENREK